MVSISKNLREKMRKVLHEENELRKIVVTVDEDEPISPVEYFIMQARKSLKEKEIRSI